MPKPHGISFDPRDPRLLHWLATLPTREELVVRMAMRAHHQIADAQWTARIDELMKIAIIDTPAKMAKLLGDVAQTRREIEGP
jgi:hypothetical protein